MECGEQSVSFDAGFEGEEEEDGCTQQHSCVCSGVQFFESRVALNADVANSPEDAAESDSDDEEHGDADPEQTSSGPVDAGLCFAGDGQKFTADAAEAGLRKPLFDAIIEGVQGADGFFRIEGSVHAAVRRGKLE
ncbi:MAG: hypothetical protein RL215_2725 [Planctomycetota bacterium]